MRKPLLYSAAIHVVVLVATIVALPTKELVPVQTRALPVELLTVAEMTNLKRQAKKAVDKPKPVETPKPKPEPEKPKPVPQPEPKVEPKATPTPPEPEMKAEPIPDKKAEKKKPEEKKPEPPKPETKKPVAEKKPEKKKTFDPTKIAALLNKIPDSASQPDEAKKTDEKADASETDDADLPMTASEIDAIRQKVQQCWNVGDLAGGADADKLFAKISFSLNQDGSIAGRPTIEETSGGTLSRLFAERAIQAVQKCAPYDFLPQDKFSTWRDVELNFNLSGMM